jgi:hypothetical protein
MQEYIPAPNLSGGFHGILLAYLRKYYKPQDRLLLVAENSNTNYIFEQRLSQILVHNNEYKGNKGEEFTDFNIDFNFEPAYNLILSQALLEHVSRPCIALKNMIDLTHVNGHIFLHTQNPQMGYHAFPIDCVRFFKDWFVDMQKYLPIELEEFDEFGPHLFAAYRRIK